MALSEDLRRRIINAWLKKRLTTNELADIFGVGAATVTRLKALYRQTKSVKPKPHRGGHPRRISEEHEHLVESLVQRHPDWTETQYAKALAAEHGIEASAVTVGRVIRKLGYSVKKRPWSRRNAIGPISADGDASTSSESLTSPLRVWFLWTKPARTSR
jgi:transposase